MIESVSKIKIKRRIRDDLGDLESLKTSLQHFGLMNPIVINTKKELIAGQRRLEAARQLGWKTIRVVVVEKQEALEQLQWEIEENVQRKDFTHDELVKAERELYRRKNPGFFRRLWNAIVAFFKRFFGAP